MGAQQIAPVGLGGKHLKAVQEPVGIGVAFAGCRIIILHSGIIPIGNDLTIS